MSYRTKIGGKIILEANVKSTKCSGEMEIFFNGINISKNDRVTIKVFKNTIVVEIKDVTKLDEGNYLLIMKCQNEIISSNHFVKLYENESEIYSELIPPNITKGLINMNCIEGLPIDLTFSFNCNIPFTYEWRKNGIKLSNSTDDFE
jgi:hypothetical protein